MIDSSIMTRQKSHEAQAAPPDPRAHQKARTRTALVEAAAALLRDGGPPTVAQAAELAKVSRATAYRYFPTQDSLLVEIAQINPATEPMEQWIAGLPEGGDASERLGELVTRFNRLAAAEEMSMRTALRVYLDTWLHNRGEGEAPPVREGRRVRWLDEVLAPVKGRLKPAQWKRLRSALALTVGVEALVVMRDVCRLSDAEMAATLEWAAMTLLRSALDEAAPQTLRRRNLR
jgi:AcrR family transcriptional regulator